MTGSFCIPALFSCYYLKHKRQDLDIGQRVGLSLCGITYAGQVALKLFYIQRNRPVPLAEALSFFFMINPCLYALPAYIAKPVKRKYRRVIYAIATTTFLSGIYILLKSEYDRKRFKEDPKNKGKLYVDGWNALCRNPNYFAELLIFTGWNMFTFNPILTVLETLAMAGSFWWGHIPDKERYLKSKYPEWKEYQSVPSLIPYLI